MGKLPKNTLRFIYHFLEKIPLVNQFARWVYSSVIFRNERLLLKGAHKNLNPQRSIVFFTVHKCASGYVNGILKKIALDSGMTPIDLDGYYWDRGLRPKERDLHGQEKRIYKSQGYFYGPLRSFNQQISALPDYRVILMLRDPRDVLTSAYFSTAYSHRLPDKTNSQLAQAILKRRQLARSKTIDQYVLETASLFLTRYEKYCQNLLSEPGVLLVKYEDMVRDFSGWLHQIITFLGLRVSKRLSDEILSTADFKVEKEDIYKHKRQVAPGDYQRKLRPETITKLNLLFYDILTTLGYQIS